MNPQPSEFIANNPQRITTHNTVPGTVVALKSPHQWIHAKTGSCLSHEHRMRADTLPTILFDPLDTDTNTDKENNNENN